MTIELDSKGLEAAKAAVSGTNEVTNAGLCAVGEHFLRAYLAATHHAGREAVAKAAVEWKKTRDRFFVEVDEFEEVNEPLRAAVAALPKEDNHE